MIFLFSQILFLYIAGVKNTEYGDITARKEFREKKECKSFKWYLENIYPESNMPLDFFALGEVRLTVIRHRFLFLKQSQRYRSVL